MRALTLFTATLAVVLGLSFGAQAATLSLTFDKATYSVSEAITMTVIGDSTGLGTFGVFGTLNYDGALVSANGDQTQKKLKDSSGNTWIAAGMLVDTPYANTQDAFAQTSGKTLPVGTTTRKLTAVMSFNANAAGVANFSWKTTTAGGTAFNFFGLAAPGPYSVTIIPEPATAGLMGLGLLGLVVAGRRRKS